MNEHAVVSIISMLAVLGMFVANYRAYRVGASKTVVMALTWAAIFAVVIALFVVFGWAQDNSPVTSDII